MVVSTPMNSHNPYIIGRPIYEPERFYGRDDLFQFIRDNLKQKTKVILLHGQRRIGKSSVLCQIPLKLQLDEFFFVSLSLEGKSQKLLHEVLYDFATEIKQHIIDEFGLPEDTIIIPSAGEFKSNIGIFTGNFLLQVYEVLRGKNLVLLLDEFDVLGDHQENAAVKHFFSYLQSIISQQEKLYVIPVVGRRLDDLPKLINLFNFHEAVHKEIGLLEREYAEQLIVEPAQGNLEYRADGIEAILELSAGHPYFTQVICFALFSKAREQQKWLVERDDVEKIVESAIELGEAGLVWFHDGLPRLEQVIFSAVAEAQERDISHQTLLEEHRISESKNKNFIEAEEQLIKWGFTQWKFVEDHSQLQITVELVRLWWLKRHPFKENEYFLYQNDKKKLLEKIERIARDEESLLKKQAALLELIERAAINQEETLDLSLKELTSLPPEIGKLKQLKFLDLRQNKLENLPPEIGQLTNLTGLALIENQLKTLPKEIGQLSKLERFHLTSNQLSSLPAEIGQLSNLQVLYLPGNKLESLPTELGRLTKLKQLALQNNQLKHLPLEMGELNSLKWLNLSTNKLEDLPSEFGNLESLIDLDLSYNQLQSLPPKLGELHNLLKLKLTNNKLNNLPEEIGLLTNLDELDINSNQLQNLPSTIGELANLISLEISRNKLTVIPDTIANLQKLQSLQLSYNQLTSLPSNLDQLRELKVLRLANNQLKTLPLSICNLVRFGKLKILDIEDNLLPIPQEVIFKKDEPKILIDYYTQGLKGNKQFLNEAKILLVGEASVGKTSLIRRLLSGDFDPNLKMTDGIQLQPLIGKHNDKQIKLNIWDFGGQEIMHATHQFFLTERSLYLLVLNSRNSDEQNRLLYWLDMIESFGGDSPIVIVGNKVDEQKLNINRKQIKEKYKVIDIIETSCLTGKGIEELRRIIYQEADKLIAKEEIPVKWLGVKTRLENEKELRAWYYISYDEYRQMCKEQEITREDEQDKLINFLHNLGVVVYFRDDEFPSLTELKKTAVLNPLWVTEAVYKIINDNLLMTTYKGVLFFPMLERILGDMIKYPKNKHQYIIDMMIKFERCFKIEPQDDEPEYLLPDLLPKDEPYTGSWENALAFRYTYNFLPNSIISRFIVRMKKYFHQNTYWRTGVVLSQGDNQAIVKAWKEQIDIYINGPVDTGRSFLQLICHTLDEIHQTIAAIQATKKIMKALPECSEKVEIEYDYLLKLEQLGKETFVPSHPGIKRELNVKEVLQEFRLESGDSDMESSDIHQTKTAIEQSEPRKNSIFAPIRKFFSNDS